MNTKATRGLSRIVLGCILPALLAGCGSKEVTEVVQTETQTTQQISREMPQQPGEMPEIQAVEISEENIAALVQAGLDAVAEESQLWSITEMTDTETLMELMQGQGSAERPEGEAFEGEQPENMTPPDGDSGERPEGEMPQGTMPEWDGENPPENNAGGSPAGEMPEGEMPEDGQGRGEGGGQPGNRGGGMSALAIVIANTDGTAVTVETVLAEIEAAAETLGYSTMTMELPEEQSALVDIPEGYTLDRILLINAQMAGMDHAAG